jgi:enoyl-CoA hydratase
MDKETVLCVEDLGPIQRFRLNRPDKLNALNGALIEALDRGLNALPKHARVLILSGAGDRAFAAGADIQEMQALSAEEAAAFSRRGHEVFARFEAMEIPVIAEVHGYCLGGGCELMLACDFALASSQAVFGFPEVTLGVIPGFGGSARLVERAGLTAARQLILTGDKIDAATALRMGVVNEVLAPDALRTRVDSVADKVVKAGPRGVAMAKRALALAAQGDRRTALAAETELFGLCFSTRDQAVGMEAFLARKPPVWLGH